MPKITFKSHSVPIVWEYDVSQAQPGDWLLRHCDGARGILSVQCKVKEINTRTGEVTIWGMSGEDFILVEKDNGYWGHHTGNKYCILQRPDLSASQVKDLVLGKQE
jgi:hypothetical protein